MRVISSIEIPNVSGGVNIYYPDPSCQGLLKNTGDAIGSMAGRYAGGAWGAEVGGVAGAAVASAVGAAPAGAIVGAAVGQKYGAQAGESAGGVVGAKAGSAVGGLVCPSIDLGPPPQNMEDAGGLDIAEGLC